MESDKMAEREMRLARTYPVRMSFCRDEAGAEAKRLKAHAERIRRTKAKKKQRYGG